MKILFLALTGAAALSAANAAIGPAPKDMAAAVTTGAGPWRLPGTSLVFAARLAQRSPIMGPAAWTNIDPRSAWRALATDTDRQAARWDYARSLIGLKLGAEALGVLDVMRQDDPDLRMVDAFRLARGAALTLMQHHDDALAQFNESNDGAPLTGPEACAWQMRLLAESGYAANALKRASCAWPALRARDAGDRKPFLIAAARAAVDTGRAKDALRWLDSVPDRDPEANLYRARANIALGQMDQARFCLARAQESGALPIRMAARLSGIEAGLADRRLPVRTALGQLAQLRFGWRGDHVEERSLQLTYRLADEIGDNATALKAGATLLRYFDPERQPPGFFTVVQGKLATLMAPGSRLPLDRAAGLFWDYRDMLPSGVSGDVMVTNLSDQLQRAGLYDRAAELLEYQLLVRMKDLAQGPLSAKVGSLFILAGRPDHALTTLRRTDNGDYTDEMLAERRRVEAIALNLTGRTKEAVALLQDVPDGAALEAEIFWKQRNWKALAAKLDGLLPRPALPSSRINDVDQTIILRQAIALAMLGRSSELVSLHTRYGMAFASLPSAAVFNLLTGPMEQVDSTLITRAMAAIPSSSPVGTLADLIDTQPVKNL